jgi:hypothetical protein
MEGLKSVYFSEKNDSQMFLPMNPSAPVTSMFINQILRMDVVNLHIVFLRAPFGGQVAHEYNFSEKIRKEPIVKDCSG